MHGNEDHDPLDGWLSQQVRPLPPPPGTFELITKRARRRKIRKLAVTVGSAAAVAAAVVAVAVPGGLLRLNPSPTSVNNVAAGQTPTPSGRGTHQQTGTGTPDATPKPSHKVTSTPASTGPTEPVGPVPANFQPSSITFVDTDHAWVIGQAGTPGHCADANPYYCTSIVRTDNAGQSWHGGPAPKTGPAAGATGVSGIRFLDGVNGWAFGPELWVTHDAGNTWSQLQTGGQRVTDLETANGRAYALWATCSGSVKLTFANDCTSFTLMTTSAGSDNWVPVGGATNGLTNGGAATSAVLVLSGSAGYLVAPNGTLYSGPVGGAWQRIGTVPCQPGPSQPVDASPSRIMFAAGEKNQLALACSGPSYPLATIFTSSDNGATWTEQPSAAWSGVLHRPSDPTSLSAATGGMLVLASTTGIYVLPAGGSQWVQAVGYQTVPGGFTYVGMTTAEQGVALPLDTSLQEIWMTFNGGQTWAPTTPITPGN